jgi:hypothetical protein
VGGVSIGRVSGGAGTPLIVALNSSATPARVQEVVRRVAFSVASQNPSAQTRTLDVTLNDGEFAFDSDTKQIAIIKVNDRPVLSGIGGSLPYQQNHPPIAIAAAATVTDVDSPNFAGGKLTIEITKGLTAANRIFVGGPFVNNGRNILLNGVLIGIRNTGGGQGTTKLEITLTAKATPALVQQILRALRFRTVNNDTFAPRFFAFTLSDGDGGTSDTVSRAVNVEA